MKYSINYWKPKNSNFKRFYVADQDGNQIGHFHVEDTSTRRQTTDYYQSHRVAKGDTVVYDEEITLQGDEDVLNQIASTLLEFKGDVLGSYHLKRVAGNIKTTNMQGKTTFRKEGDVIEIK